MEYFLNETEEMVRELFRDYVNGRIIPMRNELDEKKEVPREILEEMAKMDCFQVLVPEKYGGIGNSHMLPTIATEELSRGDAGLGVTFAAGGIAVIGIILFSSEEQKQKYLPKVARGEILTAFAITEPEAGSDPGSMKTGAVKKGNKYVLNGVKQFITNGNIADLYMVIAVTDPEKKHKGQTAFLIEKGTPGLSFGKKEEKLGIRSSATCEVILEDCEVPEENIVGELNKGFYTAMEIFNRSRIGIGAQAVGIGQAALDEAMTFARERKQFGKSIDTFQAIQFMLADMATNLEAARNLVYHAARCADANSKSLSKAASMAKLFASDMAMRSTVDAVQIMGGYGYMKDYPAEKLMRDAKITQIYEGTNQIQRIIIANALIKELKEKI